MKLAEIADRLNCKLLGDPKVEINGVAGIENAQSDQLTFLSNPKYSGLVQKTKAGAIILNSESQADIPTLISENPYLSFAMAVELFYQPPAPIPGIHPTACVADSARLGKDCSLGPNVVINEGADIGDHAILHPNVTIYPHAKIGSNFLAHSGAVVREYCRVGNNVILQPGAVVGADGFGFAPRSDKSYYKILQAGIAVLEDDVELGANTCVDRATVGETRVRRGTKIDNLVQIGHGSEIGEDCALAAQVGVAGTTKVGNKVILAGQVGIAGHLKIGDGVIATAQTGVAKSIEDGRLISGTPEMDSALWKKNYLLMQNFPEMAKTLRKLEKHLKEIEGRLSQLERS